MRLIRLAALAVITSTLPLQAQDVLVLDFPDTLQHGEDNPPVGLAAWPTESHEGLASIRIPLLSLNDDGCLLVTVMFEDAPDRILLAKWQDAAGQESVVASGLSDGVSGWNQRTFKVPYENLQGDGTLLLETDAEKQPIKRVVLAWTWPTGVYMSPGGQGIEVVQDAERVYTDRDLGKVGSGPIPDSWTAGIWRAYLQEKIEPLDEATEFSVPFETLPRAVIFRARVFGFPLDAAPEIWVNGRKVAQVSMEVPGLGRPGYFRGERGEMLFAGWRNVEAVLPAQVFSAGENSIVLSGHRNAYINEAMLELSFEKEGSPLVLEETGEGVPPPPSLASPQIVTEKAPLLEPVVISTPPSI